jgi:copper(I)-binding protein
MKTTKLFLLLPALALALALGLPGLAQPAAGVRLLEGWVRLTPPTLRSTAAYVVLSNPTGRALRLTGGSSEVAGMVMPMTDYRETRDGVEIQGMREVRFLEIPAGGWLELRPGGKHLMLTGLKRPLREGERIALTLRFEGGATARLTLTVQNR